ncbi:MAG: hypothetical protein Q9168_005782 [Polycauliona sp. 1 TL-2023]
MTKEFCCEDEQSLDTIKDIVVRADGCDFCTLAVAALHCCNASLDISASQDVTIYLYQTWSGSYSLRRDIDLDDPKTKSPEEGDVSCMVLFAETPRSNPGRRDFQTVGIIRLLANDAHLLGQQPMLHGRIIGNHVAPDLLLKWIKRCNNHHTTCKQIRWDWGMENMVGPRALRYIDTKNMCLCFRPRWEVADHVALSYVWGGSQGLQLLKANEKELFVKGSLTKAWTTIPAVIRDAIELVRDLNDHSDEKRIPIFLWVDQMCIIQDDSDDKALQLQQMDQTYSTAIATLIAAEGSHSNVPLTRRRCDSAFPRQGHGGLQMNGSGQTIKNIQGLRLLAALPGPSSAINPSVWNKRAWTMQEAELSHACIIFGKDQVTFRCAQEVFYEDIVTEPTTKSYKLHSPCMEGRKEAPVTSEWPGAFKMYTRIVESYTDRAMTYPTDVLPAFQGISLVLHALCTWKSLNGLIEDVIDFSLLWRPKGHIQRRFRYNGDPDQQQSKERASECLPTYAWSAWLGPVTYQPQSFEIKSLIHHFEVVGPKTDKRRIFRFSQNADFSHDDMGKFTLEPEPPYAPSDVSTTKEITKTMTPFGPMTQNLAYRSRIVKSPYKQRGNGPCILQFQAGSLGLILSAGIASDGHDDEDCQRLWLLDDKCRKVGTVWYVSALDDYKNGSVDVVLLSKNKSASETADG